MSDKTLQLQEGIIQFVMPPREFVLLNCTGEPIECGFDGQKLTVPKNDVAVKPVELPSNGHKIHGVIPRFTSAPDADGELIPGSLLIYDIVEDNGLGGEEMIWSAGNAIRHVLGVSYKADKATSLYAQRGLSLLPVRPTKGQVDIVRAGGQLRSEDWQYETSRQVVATYEAREAMRKGLGLDPLPFPREFHAARAILAVHEKREEAAAQSALNMLTAPEAEKPLLPK